MKSKMIMKPTKPLNSTLINVFSAVVLSAAAQAALVVYEPFDYASGTDVVGKSGGTGFSAVWSGTGTTGAVDVGTGLGLGSLSVTGGAYLRSNRAGNSVISRTITSSAQTALTGNATIWFSVLMDPTGFTGATPSSDGYAANTFATLVFSDTAFSSASGTSTSPLAGNAFGVGFVGEQVGSDLYDFTNVGIRGGAYNEGVATTNADATVADVGDVVSFIVGRIDFAPNGSNDILRLYRVTDPGLALPSSPFATLSVDLDQSGFDMISIADSQTSMFDEIRIGTTYASVIPEPSTVLAGLLLTAGLLRRRRA
jgi:hypothetical protein